MLNSELYKRDLYTNKNINILINKKIVEFDLKSANTSLCREYSLIPKDEIDDIANMSKEQRVVTIGKKMRKDEKFKNSLKEAFIDIRKRFFDANNIEDKDIIAIKKDAIFCIVDREYVTEFGYCRFMEKNVYSSYMYLNSLEFYYKANPLSEYPILDIKGMSNDAIDKHKEFMMRFFGILFEKLETADMRSRLLFIKRFIDKYKTLQLEVGYYREFNGNSIIRMNDSDITYDNIAFIPYEHKHDHINIDYNFFNILLPIVKMLI